MSTSIPVSSDSVGVAGTIVSVAVAAGGGNVAVALGVGDQATVGTAGRLVEERIADLVDSATTETPCESSPPHADRRIDTPIPTTKAAFHAPVVRNLTR